MARAKQVKSLSKVQSRITKKKGSGGAKALHEHSRDARSLGRAVAREEKLSRMYAERERSTQPYCKPDFHVVYHRKGPWLTVSP